MGVRPFEIQSEKREPMPVKTNPRHDAWGMFKRFREPQVDAVFVGKGLPQVDAKLTLEAVFLVDSEGYRREIGRAL